MLLVARVDTLRRISEFKVNAALETGYALDDWPANIFSHAWIYSGFVNHHRPGLNSSTNGFRCALERLKIRALAIVDGGRDCNDKEGNLLEVLQIARIVDLGRLQLVLGDFARAIVTIA